MSDNQRKKNNISIALALVGLVIGMVCLAYAAVPLYRIFCDVSGFGGATRQSSQVPDHTLSRKITVRFNADVSPDIYWDFKPLQPYVEVSLGENRLAFFEATNRSSEPVTGVATFNVTPDKAGAYFNKVQCFCFNNQTLQPGQTVQMPVSFFIDPAMNDDPNMAEVTTLTLSYTFFRVKN